ncbi:MAG TPA: AMP-binding protein, partial [Solirubrobacteraceae bacterium]
AGRTRAETEPLIGFFVNTLALRVDLSGRPSFRALLRRVRATVLEALANQDVPFERLVEELAPGRDTRRTPLVQVMVNQLNAGEAESPERWSAADGYGAKFDVTLYASEEADRLRLLLVYARDLFDAARMAEMVEQLATLLRAAAEAPDTPVGRLPLATRPVELGPLIERWPGAVSERVARHPPERVAVEAAGPAAPRDGCWSYGELDGPAGSPTATAARDGRWSYGELDARASRLAGWLREQGLRRGELVAVEADRSGALACALLGVWRAGGAFVVLDAAHPERRRAQLKAIARPAVVLKLRDGLPAGPPLAEPAGPDDLAYLAFTSGTTGAPKAVGGRHGPLAHFLAWHAETFELGPDDRFSLLSGLGHDPLLRDVFAPLWAGGTLCVPDDAPDWPARARITVAHLVPSVARVLAAEEPAPALRLICLGGDVATGRDVRALREWAPKARIVAFYGTTETPQAAGWHADPGETDDRPLPLGTGVEGVQLLVLRDDLEPAGVGELGEVVVRTPHLTDCASVEIAGVRAFRTGDRGRYDAAGRVHFAGRADDQLKVRGVRIEPAEVEAALRTHAAVADAHVAARPALGSAAAGGPAADSELVACVVAPDATTADLRAHLAERLPAVMVPTRWALLDALPRNAAGKVDRAALPAPAAAPANTRPATTDLERKLAGVWANALGRPRVGAEDDFFDLGGHSLLATQVVARIRSELGIELALRELFERPTVAGLAAAIEKNGHRPSAPPITPLPRRLEAT